MGVLAEIGQAKIKFNDPPPGLVGFDTSKVFSYEMQSFEIEFGTKFDSDPAVGIGGSPAAQEDWRIGIVQNVLYSRYRFVYEHPKGNTTFFREEVHPSVDMVDGSHEYPFYADPKNKPGAMVTRPVSHIVYTSKGYTEQSSKSKTPDNSPSFFNMWDQPGGGAPFTLSSGDSTPFKLKTLEKMLIFQTWLVAIKPGEFNTTPGAAKIREHFIPDLLRKLGTSTAALACIPPFSLNFWADVDLATFRPKSSFDVPNVKWGLYGGEGFFPKKPFNRSVTGLGPFPAVKPQSGDGGRRPVITGPTSLESSRAFLRPLGLDI
jgi:hypothetical protein